MKKKLNIVFCGKTNTGKTSTLMYLAALLAGGSRTIVPSIWNSVNSLFFRGGKPKKDARFIIDYKDIRVFIATGGDTWNISTSNYDFFMDDFRRLDLYVIDLKGVHQLNNKSKTKLHGPDICICACRTADDRNGAIEAIHSYSKDIFLDSVHRYGNYNDLMSIDMQLWIKRNDKTIEDQAKELFMAIDSYSFSHSSITIPI